MSAVREIALIFTHALVFRHGTLSVQECIHNGVRTDTQARPPQILPSGRLLKLETYVDHYWIVFPLIPLLFVLLKPA